MNKVKEEFTNKLKETYGPVKKLGKSSSLFEFGDGAGRVYTRYSKLHPNGRTFFGLRKVDLQELEGYSSLICFLWENQQEPLLVPFSEYEELFQSLETAADGQYKVQVYLKNGELEFYIPRAGKFNVNGYTGFEVLDEIVNTETLLPIPDLSHSQLQTLIGSIGFFKGYDVWIP